MAYDKKFSRLTNGALSVDGNSLYGKVEEVNNPELVAKMAEHHVLGAVAVIELASGYDKMTGSFKLNGPLEEVAAMAANVKKAHEVIFRGSNEIFEGQTVVAERPYVCIWKGTFKNSAGGNQKQHENIDGLTYNMNITYCKLTIAGVDRFEIDAINNILKIDGVDILATYRDNLGI